MIEAIILIISVIVLLIIFVGSPYYLYTLNKANKDFIKKAEENSLRLNKKNNFNRGTEIIKRPLTKEESELVSGGKPAIISYPSNCGFYNTPAMELIETGLATIEKQEYQEKEKSVDKKNIRRIARRGKNGRFVKNEDSEAGTLEIIYKKNILKIIGN